MVAVVYGEELDAQEEEALYVVTDMTTEELVTVACEKK